MLLKVSVLIAAVFVQASEVLSQGIPQQYQYKPQAYMSTSQMWDPSAWTPYAAGANKVWMDYIKKATEASQQLYKQWDKTGAGDMWSAGIGFAQQMAAEAQKAAEASMKQAQQVPNAVMG